MESEGEEGFYFRSKKNRKEKKCKKHDDTKEHHFSKELIWKSVLWEILTKEESSTN